MVIAGKPFQNRIWASCVPTRGINGNTRFDNSLRMRSKKDIKTRDHGLGTTYFRMSSLKIISRTEIITGK